MKTMTLNEFKEQYSGNEIGYFYLSDENNLEYKLFSEEIKRETKLIYLLYNNEDLFLGTISSLTMKQNLDLIKRGYYKQPTFNRVNILLKEQLKNPEFKTEWDKLDPEFQIIRSLIEIRNERHLSQKQLAEITGITQADISRIENGNANPSLKTLQRLANGLGMKLKLEFIPY